MKEIYRAEIIPKLEKLTEGVMHTTIAGNRVTLREPLGPFMNVPPAYRDEVRAEGARAVEENQGKRVTLTLYDNGTLKTQVA